MSEIMPFLAISLSLKTRDVLVLADTLIFKLAAGSFLILAAAFLYWKDLLAELTMLS